MIHVSDEVFQEMVDAAVQSIPPRFAQALNNIVFMIADEPTPEQRVANGLVHRNQTLLGLYEGIPLPARSENYGMVVPDMITVFKLPHEYIASDLARLRDNVQETVWHEVAHYFGLDHGQIDAIS